MISKKIDALAVFNGCAVGVWLALSSNEKGEAFPFATLLAADTFATGFLLKGNYKMAVACALLGSLPLMCRTHAVGIEGDQGWNTTLGFTALIHGVSAVAIGSELGVIWSSKKVVQYVF